MLQTRFERTDEQTDERTYGQTDERTDGRTVRFYYAPNFIWGHKKERLWSDAALDLLSQMSIYSKHFPRFLHTLIKLYNYILHCIEITYLGTHPLLLNKLGFPIDGVTSNYRHPTVLNLSKLKKITATEPQPQRTVCQWNVLRNLRTLHIVWSLVRRRLTRRLTRLQTMYNVLRYRKTW